MALNTRLLRVLTGIQLVIIITLLLKSQRYNIQTLKSKLGNTSWTLPVSLRAQKLVTTHPVPVEKLLNGYTTGKIPRNITSLESKNDDGLNSIYRDRLKRVNEMCQKYAGTSQWKDMGPSGQFYSYGGATGLHYCIVPKVGCTFWKRIFRFLNKDYPMNKEISHPSQIDRTFVHYGGLKNTKVTPFKDRVSLQLFSKGHGFMLSRDPYTRLWSAYIDKFYLPDFWRSFAIYAVKAVRANPTKQEISCPKDVSFEEFLRYIVKSANALNEHWEPVYRICSPCHFQFDVIGKQESFSTDTKFILDRYGLENLLEVEDSNSRVDEEISMLIKYNFDLENKIVKGCFQKMDVASRLWKAFQINGYIHKDNQFDEKSLNLMKFDMDPETEFLNLVRDTLKDQRLHNVSVKSQKRAAMLDAYRSVPIELLKTIIPIYQYDFELFDYEIEPKDIFSR